MQEETAMRDHVGSLERGLAVMEILAAHPAGLTLTEVAEKGGLTRAGARRFLLTLCAVGYAVQSGRQFTLSPRLLTVARTWLQGASLWNFAEPFMRKVADELNESCSAAVLSDEDVVYVVRIPGRHILNVGLHVGTRLPAYCTAMGRVLLSGLSAGQRDAFLTGIEPLERTSKTITDKTTLAGKIEAAAKSGYALVDEELEIGLRSLAVPIRNRTGAIVAAINVSTQSARYSPDEMVEKLLPSLLDAAASVEDYFAVQ